TTLGAALYRANEFDKAIEALRKAEAVAQMAQMTKAPVEEGGTAWDWIFLAMAHHKKQDVDGAKKFLEKARQGVEQIRSQKLIDPTDVRPTWNKVELDLLLKEASRLIEKP